MPPLEIFVVRHSERMDKKNPNYSVTTTRPHDPPITVNGTAMAVRLGRYLATEGKVDPSNVVVLSSPLTRCVMTGAGIVKGLLEVAVPEPKEDDQGPRPPIYVEPTLAESAYWEYQDMLRNPAVAGEGFLHLPDPLWLPATSFRADISAHVRTGRPYRVALEPEFTVEDHKLVERAFEERCAKGAEAVMQDPLFDGRTVICVSHGEASLYWSYDLATTPPPINVDANPPYTAFMHLVTHDSGSTWTQESVRFIHPHLDGLPSEY